ncbi:MAG: TIGR00645 family protein [Alphaproteobacteria bacterium]|nr:TIGR00645 family protein [Alphaproteobacteria bacterium]
MIEKGFERGLFNSRWLLAPFYFGLVGAIVLLLVKFIQELFHLVPKTLDMSENDLLLGVLTLVDLSLAANLLILVIFSGYENFVSKMDTGKSEDRPSWMGKIDYGGLKLKLITSIVAISAIQVLKAFMNIGQVEREELAWMVGIHMVFVVSGVMLALMDRLAPHGGEGN